MTCHRHRDKIKISLHIYTIKSWEHTMIIYADDKRGFMNLLDQDQLADRIRDLVKEKMNRTTGQAEYNSWVNSLQYMGRVLSDNTIPNDVGVAIEYNIPQTGMRIDFMVSGYDDQNQGNAIVIELKQWEKIKRIPASDGVIETEEDTGKDVNVKSKDEFVETYTGGRLQEVSHPSYQAWSYCQALESFNENVQDNLIQLHPCAYLHNYVRKPHDPLFNEQYQVYLDKAPAFIKLRAGYLNLLGWGGMPAQLSLNNYVRIDIDKILLLDNM
jgi:hypothetical protein